MISRRVPRGRGVSLKKVAALFRLQIRFWERCLNPFGAPEPLPILEPSNFAPKNEFPVVKGLSSKSRGKKLRKKKVHLYRSTHPFSIYGKLRIHLFSGLAHRKVGRVPASEMSDACYDRG